MPPHSFAEWIIGQNLPRRIRKPYPPSPPNNEVQQYKLELFTDDELQVEKVALTYPRAVRIEKDEPAEPENPAAKKVSFSSPPKPAIKKTAATSPPETPQDAPAVSDKDADTSSSLEYDYSSDGHGRGRRRRRTRRHRSRSRSSKSASSARDSDDSEPCRCPKCKAKQTKRGLRYRERRLNQKLQELRELERDSSSDEFATSGDELPRPRLQRHASKKKQKASPVPASPEDAPQTEESESETSYESYVSTDTDSPRRRRRSRRSHRRYFRKRQSKNSTPKGEEVKEKEIEKEPEVKNPEVKETEATGAAVEPPKPRESLKAPAVQPAPFRAEPVPRQGFLRPNLLLPVKAHVLKVEHAVEEPEDPRPNSFYDVDSGTIRVYHGPVYGNPTGTMYPIRNRNRVASLPVGTPHPMSNPYYEASPFGVPYNPRMNPLMPPPMPYWPGQPAPSLPGLPGYPPVPYYSPVGLEPRARTVSSDSNGRLEAHAGHDYQKRKSGRGKRSPPNKVEKSRTRRDDRYYGSPPDRRQKHRRHPHGQRARENEGNEGNEGLNSNNNAANVFNNDANNGEGWGRSAWDDPPPPEEIKEDSWGNTVPVEAWDNDAGANQADQNRNDWGGTDQKEDRWGAGSADNDNNNNNGETDYWANANANVTASQKNWHNDNSGGQNGDRPSSANDNDSWKRSSSGYTGLPSDSNVIPPSAYRKKSMEIRRDSGEAGNWGWVEQPPIFRREHQSMPGAWEDPISNTQDYIFENRDRLSRARRNKTKVVNDRDDFVPSWGDPTAAQSSHDPPAFRNSKDKMGKDAPEAEQW